MKEHILGTWIGISHQSVTVYTFKADGTFLGSIQTPFVQVNGIFEGKYEVIENVIKYNILRSEGLKNAVPMEDTDTILKHNSNYFIARGKNQNEITFTRVQFHRPRPERADWAPIPPLRLTTEFFLSAKSIEDIDSELWAYLCDLFPRNLPFTEARDKVLEDLSPELQKYYLCRGFDWERGSSGLEGVFMSDSVDSAFLEKTATAFDGIGANEHSKIIRTLIPVAEKWASDIEEALAAKKDFDDSKNPFEEYEFKWDNATIEYDFYKFIFIDMQKYPEKYVHPDLRQKITK